MFRRAHARLNITEFIIVCMNMRTGMHVSRHTQPATPVEARVQLLGVNALLP